MIKQFITATLAVAALLGYAQDKQPCIIPEPVEITLANEGSIAIGRDTHIHISDSTLSFFADYLADYTSRFLGIPLQTGGEISDSDCITLSNLNNGQTSGGYRLEILPGKGVTIDGNDAAGVFYGVQTLIQMLPTRAGVVPELPAVTIVDYPRFAYRGMHLDVARHFFPVDFIKKYIDYLALHKLNYFHWHLTDDQAWRIEMKSHPKLTAVGSLREGEIEGLYPGKYKPMPYGGYYTHDDVREIVQYAADRCITVIPEIDIPGHCMAVLATYPQFSTTPDQEKKCALTWGIFNKFNNVLAPTPEVFTFLSDVFSELCDIFPGQYIHVGGDECAKKWWNESKETQKFMRRHNLADEKALQSYFIHFVKDIVNAKGKTAVGWEEVLEGGIADDCVIMNWRRQEQGIEALKTGHPTIFSCSRWSYFNIKESRTQPEIGAGAGLNLHKVYDFDIVPDSLSAQEQELVLGAQACLWTEYIPATWKAEFAIFPRLSALAENVWSPKEKKDWTNFSRKIETQFERYDLWGARYNDAFFRTNDIDRRR